MAKNFSSLNLIIFFCGLDSSEILRSRVFNWISIGVSFYYQIFRAFQTFSILISNPINIYFRSAVIFKILMIIYIKTILFKRRQLFHVLHKSIWDQMLSINKSRAKKASNYLTSIWILLMIICFIVNYANISYSYYQKNGIFIVVDVLLREFLWSALIFSHLVASVSIYAYLVFIHYLNEEQLCAEFMETEIFSTNVIKQFRQKFIEIQKLRENINENFGFVPFLWLSELFIATCLRITQLTLKDILNGETIIAYLFEYLLWATIIIIFCLFMGRLKASLPTFNSLMSKIDLNIEDSDLTNQTVLLGQTISNNLNNGFSAWDMFRLDRSLIFTFLAAVIPLSVMFIQLSK
jgi:hypothetical protein